MLLIRLHQVLVAAGRPLSCGSRTLSCGTHVGSSSLSRDRTWAPCIATVESYPLCHQGSPLTCKSLIHFEFIFCIWYEKGVQFDSFVCGCPVSQCCLFKRLSFPHCRVLSLLSHTHKCVGSFLGSLSCSTDLCVCFYATAFPF